MVGGGGGTPAAGWASSGGAQLQPTRRMVKGMVSLDWQGEVTTATGGEEQKAAGRGDGARRRRRENKMKERELTGEKGSWGGWTGAARVRARVCFRVADFGEAARPRRG
ncbi:hypothetical protein E2562_000972 [Oryza meyeriana var. granulata]|uniref:Uncharacterized protein n=1 Tax=Oryza meyeriana var. granulata TaxID=110450 RepID=A0A6G1CYC0_9ORYZ|nr:hypothetical protein E2562_000972 [Oryza meyeriana var. granulata]